MIQKSVLIGSKEGSWVPCFNLIEPCLCLKGDKGTSFLIEIRRSGQESEEVLSVGFTKFPLLDSPQFVRVSVKDGNHENVMVSLVGGNRALQTA